MATVYRSFDDCQESVSTHRRNVAALQKVFFQSLISKDDSEFTAAFRNCIKRILLCRKGTFCAEKSVKFVAAFIREICRSKKLKNGLEEAVLKWLESFIRYLSRGFFAQEKSTRYRCLQLVSICMDSITSLDDVVYSELLEKLLLAVNDKEMTVRAEACLCLAKFQAEEREAADPGDRATSALLEHMQYEAFADVRKKALVSVAASAINGVLERARDRDASVRRAVFSKLANEPQLLMTPDILSSQKRDELFRLGLEDREASVNDACLAMTVQWIKFCDNNILRFVSFLDVLNSPVALKLLKAVFCRHPNMSPKYEESVWCNLTPELVFLRRAVCESYSGTEREELLESLLPEPRAHAEYLTLYFQRLGEATDDSEMDRLEYIITQLLLMAKYLDYGDEVGRREMLNCTYTILQNYDSIPLAHINAIVPIIRKVSLDEQDFVFNVANVLSDIKADNDEQQRQLDERLLLISSTDPSDIVRQKDDGEKKTIQKCLETVKALLELVQGKWADYPELATLMNEIVLPVMVHSERSLRLTGAQCLGLCCTLDRATGLRNMRIFLQVALKGDQELRLQALKTMFDLVVLYGMGEFEAAEEATICKTFKRALVDEDPLVETLAVEGVAKLLLLRILNDKETLRGLLMLYFHPRTQNNERMLQCLTYFFSVYSQSSAASQALLASVVVSAFACIVEYKQPTGSSQSMDNAMTLVHVVQLLVDMTDFRRLAPNVEANEASKRAHGVIAVDALERMKTGSLTSKKWMLALANKLTLTQESCTLEQLDKITDLVLDHAETLTGVLQFPMLQLRKFASRIVKLEADFIESGVITEAEPNLLAITQGKAIGVFPDVPNFYGSANSVQAQNEDPALRSNSKAEVESDVDTVEFSD